jgi:hypothetical protein
MTEKVILLDYLRQKTNDAYLPPQKENQLIHKNQLNISFYLLVC